jgi:hypothetical protein
MHKGVTCARLIAPGWTAEDATRIVQSTYTHMPHLQVLELRFVAESLTEYPDCKDALGHLLELHTFSIVNGVLDLDVINTLAVLPHIKSISATYDRNAMPLNTYPLTLPDHPFQLLNQLILTTPIPPLTTFLENCSIPTISVLRIDTPRSCFTTPLQVFDLLTVLLNRYGSIHRLELEMLNTDSDLTRHPPQYTKQIGIQHLRPLLSFGGITRLAIRHAHALLLSDGDVMLMARSWPCIERLDLNSEPVLCLDAPQASIFVLLEFARMCKALTHLGLFVHLPDLRTLPMVTCPFHHALYLHLGASHIHHTGVAGLFLHHLCPLGVKVEFGVSWLHGVYHTSADQLEELASIIVQVGVYRRRWERVRAVSYAMQEASRRVRSKRSKIQSRPVQFNIWCLFSKLVFC